MTNDFCFDDVMGAVVLKLLLAQHFCVLERYREAFIGISGHNNLSIILIF